MIALKITADKMADCGPPLVASPIKSMARSEANEANPTNIAGMTAKYLARSLAI